MSVVQQTGKQCQSKCVHFSTCQTGGLKLASMEYDDILVTCVTGAELQRLLQLCYAAAGVTGLAAVAAALSPVLALMPHLRVPKLILHPLQQQHERKRTLRYRLRVTASQHEHKKIAQKLV